MAYAENSRETIRKRAMHPFRTAALVEDNGKATNSPNYRYRITSELLDAVKNMGKDGENTNLRLFKERHDSLSSLYASKKNGIIHFGLA